ncbi:hypothetical protein [Paenisporosarcina sp.]|uniref:hypothetical protein n=1 Tax=Paenisporosarcina sp. TaxID=1932001 RepID=UPI003C77DB89
MLLISFLISLVGLSIFVYGVKLTFKKEETKRKTVVSILATVFDLLTGTFTTEGILITFGLALTLTGFIFLVLI